MLGCLALLGLGQQSSSASKAGPILVEGQKRAKNNEVVTPSGGDSFAGNCGTRLSRTHFFYFIAIVALCGVKYNPTADVAARGRGTMPAIPPVNGIDVPESWLADAAGKTRKLVETRLAGALPLGRVASLKAAVVHVCVAAAALHVGNAAAPPLATTVIGRLSRLKVGRMAALWPLLLAAVAHAQISVTGPCKLLALPDGTGDPNCIASSNYVNDASAENYGERVGIYGEDESCTFSGVPELPLVSLEFFARGALPDEQESYGVCGPPGVSDVLEMNGPNGPEQFCGPNGPDGVIASGDIVWKSQTLRGRPEEPSHPWLGWKARAHPPPPPPPSSLPRSLPLHPLLHDPSHHARIGLPGLLVKRATHFAAALPTQQGAHALSAAVSAVATLSAAAVAALAPTARTIIAAPAQRSVRRGDRKRASLLD